MNPFATDIDLLHWEPNILRDASAVAQTLLTGSGNLSGTTFTISAGSLTDSHVEADEAIVLGDPVAGSFPIVSVDTATTLTLSVLYDDMCPDTGSGSPSSPGSGSDLTFAIRTFWPQRRIISELLLQAAGVSVANAGTIINADCLRRPCTLGALQLIYSALAAAASEPANLLVRANLYEQLYARALRSATVEIDNNGDGIADTVRPLNTLWLRRS